MLKLKTLLCDDFSVKVQYLPAISKPLLVFKLTISLTCQPLHISKLSIMCDLVFCRYSRTP